MSLDIEDHEILEHLKPENNGATIYEIANNPEIPLNKKQAYYVIHQRLKPNYEIKSQKDPNNKKRKRYYYTEKPLTQTKNTEKQDNKQVKPIDHTEVMRKPSDDKQNITRKTNKYLHKIEQKIKSEIGNETITWDEQPDNNESDKHLILHETDIHFGAYVKNSAGDVVYDTETAKKTVKHRLSKIIKKIKQRRKNGESIPVAHLLLGGDIVTGESVYKGQPHEIDQIINNQLDTATDTYLAYINTLSDNFEKVQIACAVGNHGQFQHQGMSNSSNADDILYNFLKKYIQHSDSVNNVQLVKTDRSSHTLLNVKNYKIFLTHGDQFKQHVGTAAPKRDWLSAKDYHDFDAAFRGHYHHQRIEYLNDAPIVMTPSQKPTDDYESQKNLHNQPLNTYYIANDMSPVAEIHTFPAYTHPK